jgi:hypothetical protein
MDVKYRCKMGRGGQVTIVVRNVTNLEGSRREGGSDEAQNWHR